jgi:hypothetical protein
MAQGTHKCDCGAKYKVTVTKAPTDYMNCEKCGTLMDNPARAFWFMSAYRGTNDPAPAPPGCLGLDLPQCHIAGIAIRAATMFDVVIINRGGSKMGMAIVPPKGVV